MSIDHFTVVCLVTWPLDGSEARVDLVLIQTSLLLLCKTSCSDVNKVHLHDKSREVCIKTRSTLASLPSTGQVAEQTTVKWSIKADCGFTEQLFLFSRLEEHSHYHFSSLLIRNFSCKQCGRLRCVKPFSIFCTTKKS